MLRQPAELCALRALSVPTCSHSATRPYFFCTLHVYCHRDSAFYNLLFTVTFECLCYPAEPERCICLLHNIKKKKNKIPAVSPSGCRRYGPFSPLSVRSGRGADSGTRRPQGLRVALAAPRAASPFVRALVPLPALRPVSQRTPRNEARSHERPPGSPTAEPR